MNHISFPLEERLSPPAPTFPHKGEEAEKIG